MILLALLLPLALVGVVSTVFETLEAEATGGSTDPDDIAAETDALLASIPDGPDIAADDDHNMLSGTPGPDMLNGLGGNDEIYGLAGQDTLFGGDGQDLLAGQEGNDELYGQAQRDLLGGGMGDDSLFGGEGNDFLFGQDGSDLLVGGRGNDCMDGGKDADTLQGGLGRDALCGAAGDDLLEGEAHNDILLGSFGEDTLLGGDGDDLLIGGAGADSLVGGIGNDALMGGHSNFDGTAVGNMEFNRSYIEAFERLSGLDPETIARVLPPEIIEAIPSEALAVLRAELAGGGLSEADLEALRETYGDSLQDTLDGGAGDDMLYLESDDIAIGGSGADTFILSNEVPDQVIQITDFNAAEDMLMMQYEAGDAPLSVRVISDDEDGNAYIYFNDTLAVQVDNAAGTINARSIAMQEIDPPFFAS